MNGADKTVKERTQVQGSGVKTDEIRIYADGHPASGYKFAGNLKNVDAMR